jgi:hypothetical protein
MKYVFISRKDDQETFKKFYRDLEDLPNETLLEQYNNQVEIGIVGVHSQALKLLALRKIFLERFGESPIILEDNIVIGLTGRRSSFPNN